MKDMKKKMMEHMGDEDQGDEMDPRMEATKSALRDIQKMARGMIAEDAGSLEDSDEPKVIKVTKVALSKAPEGSMEEEASESPEMEDSDMEESSEEEQELHKQMAELKQKLAALKK